MHGLLRRAALTIDRRAGHLVGVARAEPRRARDVAGLGADRVDAAEHHVVDGPGVEARALDERLDDVRAEVCGVRLAEPAAAAQVRNFFAPEVAGTRLDACLAPG